MASNIPSGGWKVKIDFVPEMFAGQLPRKLGLDNSRVYFAKGTENNTHYAMVTDFGSEEEADEFARQWTGSSMFGETIRCVIAAPEDGEQYNHNSLGESTMRVADIPRNDDEKTSKYPPPYSSHQDFDEQQQRQSFYQIAQEEETSGPSTTSSSIKTEDYEDKRLSSQFANEGADLEKSNEFQHHQQRCDSYDSSSTVNCPLVPAKEMASDEPNNSCLANTELFTPLISAYENDSSLSTNIEETSCLSGVKCLNVDCELDHPDGWYPCSDGVNCENVDCTANHPQALE